MLWYKNWLETRWIFVFALAMAVIPLPFVASGGAGHSLPQADRLMQEMGLFWIFAAALLAGAGIRIRVGRLSKGSHGSMYYVLSMPVSRLRLFAARAGVGFLQLAGVIVAACIGVWLMLPVLRENATPSEMLRYALVVLACSSAFYFLAVLASSVIDDELGKTWGTILAGGVIWWISRRMGISPAFDLWGTLVSASPLQSSIPWTAMGVSVAASLLSIAIAGTVVQTREY